MIVSDQTKELLAKFHPKGEHTCIDCGTPNKAGEYYGYKRGISLERQCPRCAETEKKRKKAEQAELYASGEDIPEYTDEITCPWCGYEEPNSHESAEEDNEHECQQCGGIFSYDSEITITYSSRRVRSPAI